MIASQARHDRGASTLLERRSDDDLMQLARDGLGSAFDQLVRRYQAELLRVAARHLGGRTLAPDLAQDTFLRVYGALGRYEGRGAFRAYLHRVLLNQCQMARRSAQLSLRALERSQMPPTSGGPYLLAQERRRDLERALSSLTDKLRVVVLLRYWGDLDYEEIAEILAVPLGTVKRRLFDAMAKLRELVEPR